VIKGIGIDLVENKRIELLYEKYKHTFAEKILSEDELAEYHQSNSKVSYLSKHFASKEAFSKAIGTGLFRKGLYPASINIGHNELGKPEFIVDEKLSRILNKNNINSSHLSISDTTELTTAIVILE